LQKAQRRPHKPLSPARPPSLPARPRPPRPFPHPPAPPAPPGAGAAGRAARSGLGKLARRFPLLGAGLALWWLWDQLGPFLPVPAPPADGRPGRWEVWVTHENCTNLAAGTCWAWGGSTFEQLEQTFPFSGEVPTAYWIANRLSDDGKWRLERRVWSAAGSMTELSDAFVGAPLGGPSTRPVSVRLAKTYTDGTPDPDPDASWRRPVFPFDPFAPVRDPGRERDNPLPQPEADPESPNPRRPPSTAPRPRPPLLPEPPADPAPDRPKPSPLRPSPEPWQPSPAPDGPPAMPPGPARPARPLVRPPAPGRADPAVPRPDPPDESDVGDAPKVPQPAPLIRPERVGPLIGPDGRPVAQEQAEPVRQTPKDAHVINGELIEARGSDPRPDLIGIALGLGQVERKLELVLLRGSGGGGSCDFSDALDQEILEAIESLQVDIDELAGRPERELGPLAVTSEAPADFNGDGTRASFAIDIPRLPATEFETLFLQRLLEFLHWQKTCRNHVAKKGTDGNPVTISWLEVPYAE
jgi:hypothetical protein